MTQLRRQAGFISLSAALRQQLPNIAETVTSAPMETKAVNILIIGAGAAGYSAAIYAARAGLSPVLLTGTQPGGQLTITTEVENYPGFADIIQGPWLMEQMRLQAEKVGTVIVYDAASSITLTQRPFICCTANNSQYEAKAMIIATGAQAKWLGIPGEKALQGFGVSACATCDGFFFKNMDVTVVGGGNTAVEEALYLTRHAKSVTLIHRRDTLRAERILQERLFANSKINVIWNTEVTEIMGTGTPPAVSSIRLRDTNSGKIREMATEGVFVAIGHQPMTTLFKGQLPMDEAGYLKRHPDSSRTNIPGVFAAGDVADPVYRQAVTAAGMGCMAALDAEKFLSEE
jgi:thioredoxin reductase (NADPH)